MNIRLVHGDDWNGLYLNDTRVYENHNITIMDLFSTLQHKYKDEKISDINVVEYWCNPDWLEERGSFPENFNDVII